MADVKKGTLGGPLGCSLLPNPLPSTTAVSLFSETPWDPPDPLTAAEVLVTAPS